MTAAEVSILVLMEVTLKDNCPGVPNRLSGCFNPCFNGSDSKRSMTSPKTSNKRCFNPCFNGSDSKSKIVDDVGKALLLFQSLF